MEDLQKKILNTILSVYIYLPEVLIIVSSIVPMSFTLTKESELGTGTAGFSALISSNDSLEEEDSLKDVSAISSCCISSLLLLLVSEHSLVLLDKTSNLDLSSEFWDNHSGLRDNRFRILSIDRRDLTFSHDDSSSINQQPNNSRC